MLDQFSMQMLLLSETRQFLLTDDASQYQGFIVQKNIFRRAITGNLFLAKPPIRNCNISKIMMFTSPRYSLFRSYHIVCLVW